MKIRHIKSKSIITKSGLPDSDFVINPYVGCSHACVYCYARFMTRFTGHKEPWGEFLDVKTNAPELVPENTDKYKGKSITLGSVTDPYQYPEKKYKITRQILEKLIPLQPKLYVLTKSDLVVRDIDLLKQFKNVQVSFSIAFDDEKLRSEIDPGAPAIAKRIEALKEIKQAGLSTIVFISPIWPELSDWQAIVQKTRKYVGEYWFENLNIRGTNWGAIKKYLNKKDPVFVDLYETIYFTKSDYWVKIEKEIRQYCRKNKLKNKIYLHHKAKN